MERNIILLSTSVSPRRPIPAHPLCLCCCEVVITVASNAATSTLIQTILCSDSDPLNQPHVPSPPITLFHHADKQGTAGDNCNVSTNPTKARSFDTAAGSDVGHIG